MIIIEETEEDKNRAALPDEDSFEDEELTTEEAKYRSAKDLRDSLECVERYEQGVRTLLDTAALFDEIDDYEDSARLAEECRKKAKDYEKKGMEKAYQQAVKLCREAVTKWITVQRSRSWSVFLSIRIVGNGLKPAKRRSFVWRQRLRGRTGSLRLLLLR